jgi:TrmH family RNA methyltransferase
MTNHLTRTEELAIRALHHRSGREDAQLFIVEGWKGVMEVLKSGLTVTKIVVNEFRYTKELDQLPDDLVVFALPERFRMISQLQASPDILALVEIPNHNMEEILPDKRHCIYCAGIAEPGNLGTLIRSAEWFGITTIVLGPGSVDPYNSKVVQASMGALFRTACVQSKDALKDIDRLNRAGYTTIATDPRGERKVVVAQEGPFCLLLGSESHGLDEEIMRRADVRYGIPQFGQSESLNVSIAGSILLYDLAVIQKVL